MFIMKIQEVFFPVAVSEDGMLCDPMNPPCIGFRVEVVQELSWDQKVIPDSRFLGTQHIILEKATGEAASFHREDLVSVPNGFLTQGLQTLSWEEWLQEPRILINHHAHPVLKAYSK